ncbi:hypothetical protein B0F90DRAFT_1813721 [Multifurca ochricompacta]|uniref:Uncharacterized protein n=1 Tax=Multifurca ochricompacta TaxID=376703 RepID=A0AAD4MAL0_9AGAM|nr:hypothetical protein B0F90DRAFT_1813721 [Multifurca ochricompacta]
MDPLDHEDIVWLRDQLSGHAHGLSDIYERISLTIRQLEDEKIVLQKRAEELEQDYLTPDVHRLREENASLRAKLATAVTEKTEITRERDALLRKLNGVKQLIDSPTFDDRVVSDISEPKTDVTIMHDTFGRVIRPRPRAPQGPQPLSAHSSATLIDTHTRSQEAPTTLGAPFVDARATPSVSLPLTSPALRALNGDLNSSPLQRPISASRVVSLNVSPGMSEGMSLQYEDMPGSRPTSAGATVQKWRIHFAKPPTTVVTTLPKPVTTAALVEKLGLDEDAKRPIEGLSSLSGGSLRFHVNEASGLAFLYDPIFLESPNTTYVVEWCVKQASQDAKMYIANIKEKGPELHTLIYAPRKNGWHYLGLHRWNVVDFKSIWDNLAAAAHNAFAARLPQIADAAEMGRMLNDGQIVQLTVMLEQVSRIAPNAVELALMKKLRE